MANYPSSDSVKAIIDTICPEGLVSSALVFGNFQLLSIISEPRLSLPK